MDPDAETAPQPAQDLPTGEAEDFLRAACSQEPALLKPGEAATVPASGPDAAMKINPPGEQAGVMIGCYKLLDRLAEGGMGVVWLAERRSPIVQRVALKVIKPGMDTRSVIARFEQERQALALMNHPNVARVFDAGATGDGRPFFVMEYVPGEAITEYCDRQKLSVRQRLELFIPVCEAVQHAHTKGVIHRDIKPSNVLVSVREGAVIPKVIDFGIAKAVSQALTEKTIFTELGQIIGTPEYMSPEQAEMGATDIDTRTDVYSLGVVLYELLAGLLPFDARTLRQAGYDAIRRVLREDDAPKPSTRLSTADNRSATEISMRRRLEREELTRELRRELDWIPLKALRKDRTERYQTPLDLARDVQRYLNGEPLEAGPEGLSYRARKFARRHRGPVLASLTVVAALAFGLIATLWMAGLARIEAKKARMAEAEQTKARHIADTKTAEAVKAREVIEYNSYVANIEMAQAAMDTRQFHRVRQRLDACPEQLRGWEWRWLEALSDKSLTVLNGHSRSIMTVAFNPDGTKLTTASWDGSARVWEVSSGQSLAELKGHANLVSSALFSPNGSKVLTASWDHTARIWNSTTGSLVSELKGHKKPIPYAVFNHDGTKLVTASWDNTARVWDASTGEFLVELKGHSHSLEAAAFSPDGRKIVTASNYGTARVWNSTNGQSMAVLNGHKSKINSVAFSPDGGRILTASSDTTARIWDASSGQSLTELKGHTDSVWSAAFIPDGSRVVTASLDKTARVWDASSAQSLTELKGHTDSVWSAAFSTDGTQILTASLDMTARLWAVTTGICLREFIGHSDSVGCAVFNADSTRIATASTDNTARVWDTSDQQPPTKLKGQKEWVHFALFNPNGTHIFSGADDAMAILWDYTSGKKLAEFKGHTDFIWCAAFSADGRKIVTGSHDTTARLWDASTGKCLCEFQGNGNAVISAVFSRDSSKIITISGDGAVRTWNAETGVAERLHQLKGPNGQIDFAVYSPDGTRIVTGSSSASAAQVWDAETGLVVMELLKGLSLEVSSSAAAFSMDGSKIATACSDGTVRIYAAHNGQLQKELSGHTRHVNSVAFSPDGTRIVSASGDRTGRVWDCRTGRNLVELKGHTDSVKSVAFSPDGTRLVTSSYDSTIRLWDSRPYRVRFSMLERARRAERE